jgi:hypothetical protein
MRRLDVLRTELTRMTEACSGVAACRILETLADHSDGHCASPDHGAAGALETVPVGGASLL